MDNSQKQQVSERIKQANNILVTVSSNPSVDQLSACIGLTLALNKMGKHATAVFSGAVPSTIEFLQPEKTLERNTDSLRDFIIALDKSKADKLRYKVEDKVVKIFITPYKTSISDRDLEFSQGDFNVDVVVALGVHDQADLDQAITAHGRILHDATVISVNVRPGGELGSVNWVDPAASSLAELATQLVEALDKKLIDNQIATALLTGIVAETNRFSNAKTSPQTMSVSAELMAAGANQQLVATKLEEPPAPPAAPEAMPLNPTNEALANEQKPDDGTLEISHDGEPKSSSEGGPSPNAGPSQAPIEPPKEPEPLPEPEPEPAPRPKPEETEPEFKLPPEPEPPQIHIDEHGSLMPAAPTSAEEAGRPRHVEHQQHDNAPHLVLQPPTFDSQLTASATPTGFPGEDTMTLPQVEQPGPLLNREPLQHPSIAPSITPPGEGSGAGKAGGLLSSAPEPMEPSEPARPNPTLTPMPPDPSSPLQPPAFPPTLPEPAPTPTSPPVPPATLSDIERNVHSPHLNPGAAPMPNEPSLPAASFAMPEPNFIPPQRQSLQPQADDTANNPMAMVTPTPPEATEPPSGAPAPGPSDLDSARDAVNQAINSGGGPQIEPIQALNAQSLGGPLHNGGIQPPAGPASPLDQPGAIPPQPAPAPGEPNLPGVSNASFSPTPGEPLSAFPQPPSLPNTPAAGSPAGPGAPPPGPPPMLPPLQP